MSRPIRICFVALIIFISLILLTNSDAANKSIHLEAIKLPPGFQIAVFADNIPNARSMVLSPKGVLFVGSRREDKVYAVIDLNGDNHADDIRVIAANLNMPNGVAFRDGALYVCSRSSINTIYLSRNTVPGIAASRSDTGLPG